MVDKEGNVVEEAYDKFEEMSIDESKTFILHYKFPKGEIYFDLFS